MPAIGRRDRRVYEGNPLGEVTVTANEMSDLEKMRYDTGKDPITRSYLNGTRPKGRKISFGEGLGYETEFWQGMQTLGEGFAYAFGGLLVAPYAGAVIGEGIAMSIPVVSSAMLEVNAITTWAYSQGNSQLAIGASFLSAGASQGASKILGSTPYTRYLRMTNPLFRNLRTTANGIKGFDLSPSRLDQPFIPLDPTGGNPWEALKYMFSNGLKSTPK